MGEGEKTCGARERRQHGWRRVWLAGAVLAAILGGFFIVRGVLPVPFRKPFLPPPAPAPEGTPDYQALRSELQDFINTQGGAFGLYFQDLRTGAEFGINENVPMAAASSIKVPIVLYLYQLAAEGKLSLAEKMAYDPDYDAEAGSGVIYYTGRKGDKYTLRTLGNMAITVSDNAATNMLLRRLGRENIAGFMRGLGGQAVAEGRKISSARDLGLYLRATLDFARRHPEPGNTLLDDLSNTIYNEGIPFLLPDEVHVAHKVGALGSVATDVGIVYLEQKPAYILSVLTEGVGKDEVPGFMAIARISEIVYRSITKGR